MQVKVARSSWFQLRVEGDPRGRRPLDTGFAQAFTNPDLGVSRRPAGAEPAAAEYCVKWIDKLQALAAADPGWRSQKEKDHVFAQFDEARQIYRRFAQEAAQTKSTSPAVEVLTPAPDRRADRASGLELLGLGMIMAVGLVARTRGRTFGCSAGLSAPRPRP